MARKILDELLEKKFTEVGQYYLFQELQESKRYAGSTVELNKVTVSSPDITVEEITGPYDRVIIVKEKSPYEAVVYRLVQCVANSNPYVSLAAQWALFRLVTGEDPGIKLSQALEGVDDTLYPEMLDLYADAYFARVDEDTVKITETPSKSIIDVVKGFAE